MSPWFDLALLHVYAALWGLRKGSVICVTVCALGLVPHVIDKGLNWRQGFEAGLPSNLPRFAL